MDWEFFWRSEHGRDRLLRDRLEQHQDRAAAARSQDRRQFERRIGELRGTLEVRLDALSRAFDAYVELDDVRERLAGFPDQAQVRRLAGEALQAIEEGRDFRALPDVAGYWLPPAVNALRPDGTLDPAGMREALARDEQSSRNFLLAVLGVIGAGTSARQFVAEVLTTDDCTWDSLQHLVALAALDGTFGADAVTDLDAVVLPVLAAAPAADWESWLESLGRTPDDRLDTLRGHLRAPGIELSEEHRQQHREDLRSVAMTEVAEGSPAEQHPIRRARDLRALVRDPQATQPTAADPSRPITDILWELATGPRSTSEQRRAVWRWIVPHLLPIVEARGEITPTPPATVTARGGSQDVAVTARGPVGNELTAARRRIQQNYTADNAKVWRWAGGAGAALA